MAPEAATDSVLVDARRLERFVFTVFSTLGLSESNARDAADVLVKSDVYGIDSHGVPRLAGYVNRLRTGAAEANPEVVVVHELPSTALVDGANGVGMVVGKRAMEIAIRKAEATGAGFVSVRNSSHFGIAGYYARMALEHDMIGFSMTNVGSGGSTPPTGAAPASSAPTPSPWLLQPERLPRSSWTSPPPSSPPASSRSHSGAARRCLSAGSWTARATRPPIQRTGTGEATFCPWAA